MTQAANSKTRRSEYLPQNTLQWVEGFEKLSGDDKLALFYLMYKKMGDSITPAAPAATEPNLAPILMGDFYNLSHADQLQVMRDIVNGADTEYSHAYAALKENNQLMVWFAWAQAMGDTVVGMPADYQAPQGVNDLLGQAEKLDFEEQMTLMRELVGGFGYSQVQPIPSQAETGKTASL